MKTFFLLLFFFSVFSGCVQEKAQINTACFESSKCVSLEIAKTGSERETGLMFRESLRQNTGMLFVFESPGRSGFWMKNTLIPLDIIWIGSNGTIVDVFENAQPCKTPECPVMFPNESASWALEVNAGFAKQNNIKKGQRVALNYEANKANWKN